MSMNGQRLPVDKNAEIGMRLEILEKPSVKPLQRVLPPILRLRRNPEM